MKHAITKALLAAAAMVAFLLVYRSCTFNPMGEGQVLEFAHAVPPPGYSILTDGNEFVFTFPTGERSVFPRGSKQEAIDSAWECFRLVKKDEVRSSHAWKTIIEGKRIVEEAKPEKAP